MKAIILAAGRGSRLKGFTEDKPKSMSLVGGKRLIEWQISALKKAGIIDISLVVGFKSEELMAYGNKHYFNDIWDETNMVYSLLCAKEEFTEKVIVSYSDIIYSSDIVRDLLDDIHDISISYDINWYNLWSDRFENPLDDAETFLINDKNRVLDIGKKPTSVNDVQGQYMGLLALSPKACRWIIDFEENNSSLTKELDMTSLLRKLIEGDNLVYGIPNKLPWFEVDTISDLEIANSYYKKRIITYP
jgi:choline kinase